MDDKIFDLIEKMHNQMQQGFKEINGKIDVIDKEINDKIDKIDKEVQEIDKYQQLVYEEVTKTREDIIEARADLRLVKIATVKNSKEIEMLKVTK